MKSQKHRQKRSRKSLLQSRGGVGIKRFITKKLGRYDKYYDDTFDVWKGFISRNQGKTFFKRIAELKKKNLKAYMEGINKLLTTDTQLISKTYGKDVLDDVLLTNQNIPEDLESVKRDNKDSYNDNIETLYNLVWGPNEVSRELVKNKYGENVWNDVLTHKEEEDMYTEVLRKNQNQLNGMTPEELNKLQEESVTQALKDYNDGTESSKRRGIELDPNKVEISENKRILQDTLSKKNTKILQPIKGGRKKRKTRNAKKSRRYK